MKQIESEQYPKVLIFGISFIPNTGGGITILNLFRNWPKDKLAVANDIIEGSDKSICENYYLLKSPFITKVKVSENKKGNIISNKKGGLLDWFKKLLRPFHSFPHNYFILKGKYFKLEIDNDFLKWVNDFNPDIIYSLAHNLYHIPFLIELNKKTNIPLAVHIVDDWVNSNHFGVLNFIGKRVLNAEFRKLLSKTKVLMGISYDMQSVYKKRYKRNFLPFHNPVNLIEWNNLTRKNWKIKNDFKIMFAGTVEAYNVDEIEKLCKAINNKENENIILNVFGSIRKNEYSNRLKKYKNCNVKGLVRHEEIKKLLVKHDLLFLPLSFNKKLKKNIILSMPTKVSEYMISGTPILVYAPQDLALIKYATKDLWAYTLTNSKIDSLKQVINKLFLNVELRSEIGKKAIEVAKKNHNRSIIQKDFINELQLKLNDIDDMNQDIIDKKFFIKDGYIPNEINITIDDVSGGNYWNKSRLISSEYYQFYVYKYAIEIIKKYSLETLIDIGCGTGRKLKIIHENLPNIKIIGIDQKDVIDFCKKSYYFGDWYVDNFENANLKLNYLKGDLIICSDIIEHLIDPDNLLDYIKKKVRKDSLIIISTLERDIVRGKDCITSPNKYHIREWNFNEIEKYLENRGFYILEHFLQYPTKFGLNKIFCNDTLKRVMKLKHLKYNQVLLIKVK
ncbi:MAG: methyltransferase domain-containing protein [Bacteroidales bacterium]|nr:methyltransferase domain-containing protein [Bacteroidales bacterium]